MAIRILIGDDDPLIREALGLIFGKDPGFQVVAAVADGQQAVEACLAAAVDVALLDIRMPRLDGIRAAARITAESGCKVLLLSTFNEDELVRGALASGASGYLLKGCGVDEIKEAVRLVHSGHAVFKDEVFASVRARPEIAAGDLSALSLREREIAKLVADGYSNREAADALGLSEGTVKNHVSSILDKLGLRQRTQIAVYCVSGRRDFS
jgi:DNA-binding NarL/FixJ family response regulator